MLKVLGYIVAGIIAIGLLIAVGIGTRLINLEAYKFFFFFEAEVRREVFQNTPSFVQGKVQEFRGMQREYFRANAEQRGGLASAVLHSYGDLPDSVDLPADVRSFLVCLKRSQASGDYSQQCAS